MSHSGYDTPPLGRAEPAHGTAVPSRTVVNRRTTAYVTPAGEVLGWDPTDPGSIEAWFGPFGHAEHFRKVVLASCRETERARATQRAEKVSEARLDDLARTSDKYVDYLIATLNGRRLREQNVLSSLNQ